MTAEEIINLIKTQFPNAQDVILKMIKRKLHEHENFVFQRVHKDAFDAGKDLGYRNGKSDGALEERLKHLGWSIEDIEKRKAEIKLTGGES